MRLRPRVSLVFCLLGTFATTSSAQVLEDEVAASDAAIGDSFGQSVSVSGDTVVIGARGDEDSEGSAYVFRRSGGGVWSQEAKLSPAAAVAEDQVGFSVGVSGEFTVLGAPDPFDLFGSASGPGTAYVYERTGTSWSLDDTLTAGDGQSLDQFGHAVSIAGDRLIVGARGDESAGDGSRFTGRGSAYVFRQQGGGWTEEDKLIGSGSASGDRVGTSVSMSGGGDVVIVGAPGDTDNGTDAGAAYIFRRSGTSWSQEAKLTASDGQAEDSFGESVWIDGDVAIVGAFQEDAGGSNAGAAYIFRHAGGGTWNQEAKLTANDAAAAQNFGISVSVSGEIATIGAQGGEAVYRFENSGGWSQTDKLTTGSTPLLGASVTSNTDFVAAGAPLATGNGVLLAGEAAIWCVNPGPIITSISPTTSLFNQNTSVTITGANFSPIKAKFVTFGGIAATGVTFVSENTLTCTAPTGTAGQTVDVVVTQNGDSDTLVGAYTYVAADLISVSPTNGPAAGGNTVTLSGTNFSTDGSNAVTFGGVAAAVSSATSTSIDVTAPAGTPGATVSVVLTSNNGNDTLASAYTYVAADLVSISPTSGPATGGNTVTLNGTDFATDGSNVVTFGGVAATVNTATSTSIDVTAPAGSPGATVDVVLNSSAGNDTLSNAYTYNAMSITGVDVSAGNFQGGQVITATVTLGTNVGDTTVTLGGTGITPSSADATTVVFTAPGIAEPDGQSLDLTITNSNGSDTLVDAFTYTPALDFAVSGNTTAGGQVDVSWVTDPTAGGGQVITIWLGDPLFPSVSLTLPGFAGVLREIPATFITQSAGVGGSPLNLPFGPLPSAISGLNFNAQALATIEGAANGTFSNVVTFSIP